MDSSVTGTAPQGNPFGKRINALKALNFFKVFIVGTHVVLQDPWINPMPWAPTAKAPKH